MEIRFEGTPTAVRVDCGTTPWTWAWDFGDGTGGSGVGVSHIYSQAGSYTVTLTVSNTWGSYSGSRTITVGSTGTPTPTPTPTCIPRPEDPSDLVEGVARIGGFGSAGPLEGLNASWIPIVGGDDDTSSPSTYAVARTYGTGRVVAIGHEGLLWRDYIFRLDNLRFALNVLGWLDECGTGRVAFSTGHAEWLGEENLADLRAQLEQRGYTFTAAPAPLTSDFLQQQSVLIVGNAWGSFSSSEIEDVRSFVNAGGGLLVAGLGWSYEPYNPGKTIDDYPMHKLTEPYQVRWLTPVISDPTDQYEGYIAFHRFYPHAG